MQQKNVKKRICIITVKLVKIRKNLWEVSFMDINKKMMIFVSCVGLVATGVMLFYAGEREEVKEDKQVYVREENVEDTARGEEHVFFEILLKDSTVTLFRIENGIRTQLDSLEIDINYYPDEDIRALTEGITAYNIEEGYKILENFAN